ncbi:uncharacterized protein LY79DRAFT_591768 [Colletotrichum navitas]|uniref:Uncharacterized protein n=1 Tax=Colletotrichum navitas TaxID=681940 RepID=A0AAD8V2P5_9PEZI|nr:uncharacterized protein LY79DRAFT_591768 [Colletotrichum navitas]KAK1585082.1 hypothetical protein LY79DRAFT_591768 [Colletotrichum navitas]
MDRMHFVEEEAEDSLALEAEFDTIVQEVLDPHYIKWSMKKLQRRIKDLQNQRFRNRTGLNLWYEKRASEWIANEMSSYETQIGHGTRRKEVACHRVSNEEEHGVVITGY